MMASGYGLLAFCLALLVHVDAIVAVTGSPRPTAIINNGTLSGVHNAQYNVDYFLNIPYAQPPTGHLRLALPQPLNSSFEGTRDASEFGDACVQFSVRSTILALQANAHLTVLGCNNRQTYFRRLSKYQCHTSKRLWRGELTSAGLDLWVGAML